MLQWDRTFSRKLSLQWAVAPPSAPPPPAFQQRPSAYEEARVLLGAITRFMPKASVA
jgi:hypothetical protein